MSYEISLIFYYLLSHSISFLCSLLEAALLSCTPSYISILVNTDPKRGVPLRNLKKNINEPLAAILTFNTAAHTIGAAGVGAMVEILYGDAYLTLASIIVTLTMLYLSEMIPKTIGSVYWKAMITFCVPVIEVMIKLTYPFVYSFKWVSKLFGAEDMFVTVDEQEVRTLIEDGVSFGVFEDLEKKIVFRVFKLADNEAKNFMINRKDADWINRDITKEELKSQLSKNKTGFCLVYENSLDNPLGYAKVSDILEQLVLEERFDLKNILKKPLFFPENTSLFPMLERLFRRQEAMAFLIDEYGGIVGVVSVEDILKEFVKNIVDTFSITHQMIAKKSEHTWEVDGGLLISDLAEIFSIDVSSKAKALGYHTLAGFCLSQLQNIPNEGDEFDYEDYHFKILKVVQKRIVKVMIELTHGKLEPEKHINDRP
ncbi:MAG: hemolysin family protein [Waddliaceae bacterium]